MYESNLELTNLVLAHQKHWCFYRQGTDKAALCKLCKREHHNSTGARVKPDLQEQCVNAAAATVSTLYCRAFLANQAFYQINDTGTVKYSCVLLCPGRNPWLRISNITVYCVPLHQCCSCNNITSPDSHIQLNSCLSSYFILTAVFHHLYVTRTNRFSSC